MSKFLGNGGFNPALSPRRAGQTSSSNSSSSSPPIAGAPSSHPMSIPTVVPASARAAHHSPASNSPLGTSPHSPLMSSGAIPIPSSSAAAVARFGQPRAFNASGSSPNSGATVISQQNMHAIQQQQQLQHVQAASAASIAVPPAVVARHKLPLVFHNPFANYAPPLLSSSVPTSHAHASMYFNPVAHMDNPNAFLFTPQPLPQPQSQQQPQQQQQQQQIAPTVAALPAQPATSSPQSAPAATSSASSQQLQQQQQSQQQSQQQQQQPQQQQHSPQQPHQMPTTQSQPAPQPQPAHHHSQPQQQQSRSLPVSIPAFRRAISFVGLDQGFSLFGPDADTDLTGGSSIKSKTQPTPPRIQNIGQLGQQLRQHLSGAASASSAAAAASSASAQSTAASSGPTMQRAASSTAMSDADQSLAPHSMLPEISSPPPTVFSFHDSHDDHLQPQPGHDSPLTLNFDGIHVGTSQPLAAIPQNIPLKQPSPQPQQPGTIFHEPPFARWGPTLSSSAPSHLPSFHHLSYRRDSANSSIASSQAASKHVSSRSSHAHAHRSRQHGGAHTPTTINSEDNRPSSGQGGTTTEQEWSPPADDDMLDENEVEARLSHTFHGDASECSLSACSSCSGESSDFSVDLEQDFDVTLTFQQHRDDDEDAHTDQAVKHRLNQAKREHHNNRHLHHRRLRIRAQIKQAREEERRGTAGEDDWKSHQLNEDEIVRVGSYTQGERAGKIQRFLEKRRRRVWSKKILYSCRKNFADKRPRVGGRFVKLKDAEAAAAAAAAAAAGGESEGASGDGFGAGAHPSSGGGSLGGSLSTSPAPLSFGGHGPGLHALTQHMHGALGVPNGGTLTGFSLPLAAYHHTNFSPIVPFGSPNPAAASSVAASSPIDGLSFLKQEIAPTAASHTASAPSGLAAALRPHAHAATSPPFFS